MLVVLEPERGADQVVVVDEQPPSTLTRGMRRDDDVVTVQAVSGDGLQWRRGTRSVGHVVEEADGESSAMTPRRSTCTIGIEPGMRRVPAADESYTDGQGSDSRDDAVHDLSDGGQAGSVPNRASQGWSGWSRAMAWRSQAR